MSSLSISPLFHISMHARPDGTWREELVQLSGQTLRATLVPTSAMICPLPVTFELVVESLSVLPRMYVEPDGSFVWVAGAPTQSDWQLDGMLWDRGGALQYVELKGRCSEFVWRQLLTALGADDTPLLVQFVERALFVAEPEFRRFVWG